MDTAAIASKLAADIYSLKIIDNSFANTINNTVGLDAVNELIHLAENAGGNDNISVDIIDII